MWPQEIAEHKGLASFWVDSAARIDVDSNTVLHKLAHGELRETKNWLTPGKPITIGVTSGASTPDRAVEEVRACGGRVAPMHELAAVKSQCASSTCSVSGAAND